MMFISRIACLLVAATVVGVMAESEVELSSEAFDCLGDLRPFFQMFVALGKKCEQQYPKATKVFNQKGSDGNTVDPYEDDRRKCMAHFKTPKVTAKLAAIHERCEKTVNYLLQTQFARVADLMDQEVWPRVRAL